jgi:hypothetical protein
MKSDLAWDKKGSGVGRREKWYQRYYSRRSKSDLVSLNENVSYTAPTPQARTDKKNKNL